MTRGHGVMARMPETAANTRREGDWTTQQYECALPEPAEHAPFPPLRAHQISPPSRTTLCLARYDVLRASTWVVSVHGSE